MEVSNHKLKIKYDLKRNSAFSYTCAGCSLCCYNKIIRVNPYEILCLARGLNMSTTEFIAVHTEAGGTVLRTQKLNNGACIFLRESRCSVHESRPFVCRIYPLGSRDVPGQEERFGLLELVIDSKGIFGTKGTVVDFLASQDLEAAYVMEDRYRAVFDRMSDCLKNIDPEELQNYVNNQRMIEESDDGSTASTWIDIDKSVLAYCKTLGRVPPDDIESLVMLHIAAIDNWIASLPLP
jgi:uncharacterized protein